MEFSLILQSHDVTPIVRAAKLAEDHGLAGFWCPDSQMLFADAHMALALAGVVTERIWLGPCATNPVTRHPSVTANCALSLDQIAPGRVRLALGTGDSAVHLVNRRPATLRGLAKTIEQIRAFMRQRRPNDPPLPIFVAASGPRGLRLAGAAADGVVATVGCLQEHVAEARAHVAEGLRSAGRDRGSFRFALNINCAIGYDEPPASWILPSVAAKVNYALAAIALPPDQQEDVRRLREAYEYRAHQSAEGRQLTFVRPWMIERFAVRGAPAAVAARLDALAEAGVDEVILGPGSAPLDAFLPALALEVRPLVRLARSRGSVLG